MIDQSEPDIDELDEISKRHEALPPRDAAEATIAWTLEQYGTDVVVASSFQDVALVDLVRRGDPKIEIVFLDTEFHFPETLAFVERLRKIWDLNLTVTHPDVAKDEFPCGGPRCCEMRKVAPLQKAIAGRKAWITGLKRVDTPERTDAPILSWDPNRSMLKVNPMVTWTDEDVDQYLADLGLPLHPLTYVGYVSIGCAPTTQPVAEGQNPREGRWPGSDKTECGLHI